MRIIVGALAVLALAHVFAAEDARACSIPSPIDQRAMLLSADAAFVGRFVIATA